MCGGQCRPARLSEVGMLALEGSLVDRPTRHDGHLSDEMLNRLVDGELCQEEADRAKHHLFLCRACQIRYEQWLRMGALLEGFFDAESAAKSASQAQCLSHQEMTAYFRNALSAEQRAEVERHLGSCSSCRKKLVATHGLMHGFETVEAGSTGSLRMHGLEEQIKALLCRLRDQRVCVECLEDVAAGSNVCPRCGEYVPAPVTAELESNRGMPEVSTISGLKSGRGRLQLAFAASVVGLALIGSLAYVGISLSVNRERPDVQTVAVDKSYNGRSDVVDKVLADNVENHVRERIEMFGRIAMFEHKPTRFEVPAGVDRTARALIAEYYYDTPIAGQVAGRDNIWDVFAAVNRLEARGSQSLFRPKFPNRILGPDEFHALRDELSGAFLGVGIMCQHRRGTLEIVGFGQNSPADNVGLMVGDLITEVDGRSLAGLDLTQSAELVRGLAGTSVRLKVVREDTPDFEVVVPRQKTSMPGSAVEFGVIAGDVGYVRLFGFIEGTTESLKDAVGVLKQAGVNRLVLDVRANHGGSAHIAADVAGLFLEEDALVATIREKTRERSFYAQDGPIWEGPVAVLVGHETMSGAELVAAVLQQDRGAIVVGQRTAGKGSVQTVYKLDDEYAVQLTTGVLACSNGFVFDKCGVEPDVEVGGVVWNDRYRSGRERRGDEHLDAALMSFELASVPFTKEIEE